MAERFDFDRLFADRVMALDRTALPALESRAVLRAGGLTLEQLTEQHAAMSDRLRLGPTYEKRGSVAIVPLVGPILPDAFLCWLFGGTSPELLVAAIQDAIDDSSVTAIVLLCDSPGGV